ncbi:MAG: hypothetical protein ABJA20_00550 [Novosphingobium sp.]
MIPVVSLALVDLELCYGTFVLGAVPSLWFGAIHTGLTLASLLYLRNHPRRGEGWNCLALPLGAIVGPCGIVALLVLRPWSNVSARRRRRRNPVDAEAQRAASQMPRIIARLLDQRMYFPPADRTESLGTILRHGSLEIRCKALETVVRSFEPRLSPLVVMALSDADQTVRALAAATSAQVSANLVDRVAHVEAKPLKSIDEQYEFAMMLVDNGCRNVLLSDSQRIKLRSKARGYLLNLLRSSQLEDHRGEAVAAALVQLGNERDRHIPAKSMNRRRPVWEVSTA